MPKCSVDLKFPPGDDVAAIVDIAYLAVDPLTGRPEIHQSAADGKVTPGDSECFAIRPLKVVVAGSVWGVAPLVTDMRLGPEASDVYLVATKLGLFRVPAGDVYHSARQAVANAQEMNRKILERYAFTLKQLERERSCTGTPPPTDGDATDGDQPDEMEAVVPEEDYEAAD